MCELQFFASCRGQCGACTGVRTHVSVSPSLCLLGSNFGPATLTDPLRVAGFGARYGSVPTLVFNGSSCYVANPHVTIVCVTSPGTGRGHSWQVGGAVCQDCAWREGEATPGCCLPEPRPPLLPDSTLPAGPVCVWESSPCAGACVPNPLLLLPLPLPLPL
jgi:hypothetical protein